MDQFTENKYHVVKNKKPHGGTRWSLVGYVNKSYVPIDKFSLQKLKHALPKIVGNKYILIDFGCGEGGVLVEYSKLFEKCIGVENNIHSYNVCKTKIKDLVNVEVIHEDLETYQFENVLTFLYMYDPLWLLNKEESERIYSKALSNLVENVNSDIYIASRMTAKNRLMIEKLYDRLGFKELFFKGLNTSGIKIFKKKEK